MSVIAAAVVAGLAPTPAPWVEHAYSRQWYLAWQNVVTPVSSLSGFSLLDPAAVLGVLGIGAGWWRDCAGPGRRGGSEPRPSRA